MPPIDSPTFGFQSTTHDADTPREMSSDAAPVAGSSAPPGAVDDSSRDLAPKQSASASQEWLPALPSSLVDALAREPPAPERPSPSLLARISGHASPTHPRASPSPLPDCTSTRMSPMLPSLPPQSPLTFTYGTSSRSNSPQDSSTLDQSDLKDMNGSIYTLAPGSLVQPSPAGSSTSVVAEKGLSASSRLWRSVGFGKHRNTAGSPVSPSPPASTSTRESQIVASVEVPPGAWSSPSTSTPSGSPSAKNTPSTASSEPILSRRLSAQRLHQSRPSNPSQWLFEAQNTNALVQSRSPRTGSAQGAGLGLLEHVEAANGRRQSVPLESLRRVSGGHGIDPDLDAMDEPEQPRYSRKRLGAKNEAMPWLSSQREHYTHNLDSGHESAPVSEGEDDAADSFDTRPSVASTRLMNEDKAVQGDAELALAALTLIQDIEEFDSQQTASRNVVTDDPMAMTGRIRPLSHSSGNEADAESIKSDKAPQHPGFGPLAFEEDNPKLSVAHRRSRSSQQRDQKADFTVAVVGPRNVGKTSVIRRGLKRPAEKPQVISEDAQGNRVTTSTSHFTIGGQARSIEVLEIDANLLQYDSEGIVWPNGVPRCEGAMLCYDSTDHNALDSLSVLLQGFWTRGSDIPLIVLACKADPEPSQNATDPHRAASVCNVYGAGIVALDGGVDDPKRKMKESFNWIIRQIMANRGESRRPSLAGSSSPQSRRISLADASTSTSRAGSPVMSRQGSTGGGPLPSLQYKNRDVDLAEQRGEPKERVSRSGSVGLGLSIVQEAPVSESGPEYSTARMDRRDHISPRDELPLTARARKESSAPSIAPSSVSGARRHSHEVEDASSFEPIASSNPPLDLFFPRAEVVDKFLFSAVTGNDDQFMTTFLIVYRRFAQPYEVLVKLIERFDFVAGRLKSDPLLSRFAQQKLCSVLSTWIKTYPSDFTGPATLSLLQPFLEGLLPCGATWVAHYALALLPIASGLRDTTDLDAAWALPDKSIQPQQAMGPFEELARRSPSFSRSHTSDHSAPPSRSSKVSLDSLSELYSSPVTAQTTSISSTPSRSPVPPSARDSNAPTFESNDVSAASLSSASESFGGRRKEASLTMLEISNALTELSETVIAEQITRIASSAFTEMTPRDLLRHVFAPRDPKNPRTAVRNEKSSVVKSIDFVNYLADWVATMILIQSRPKWRARVMEKLITVAYSLREMENFDSLMGVLAGLNAQPVFRLTETMELVNLRLEGDRSVIPKRLRSLNKLMANTKSFSAYRMALASSANMLPYLGVHLQDITVVNEVKSDMRDGKVNWTKFSHIGRSAAIILDCTKLASAIPVNADVERCIVDVPLLDKDDQYTLSYGYQPRVADSKPVSTTRRRLQNLAKSPFL